VEEAAIILSITRLTIYRMIKDGRLQAVKLPLRRNGEFRIATSEIDRILQNKS